MLWLELVNVKADWNENSVDWCSTARIVVGRFTGSLVLASRPAIGRIGSPRRMESLRSPD
jgi:hypothetical protein